MKRWVRWGAGAAATLILAAAAARVALPSVPGWFIHADPTSSCEVVILIGSNPEGTVEIEGARLWKRGVGRCLLCVGRPAAWHVTEEQAMSRHLRALGIPPTRVLQYDIAFSNAPDAGTMREEVRLLLPFLQAQRFHSVMVVIPAMQSRRRALLLRPWHRAGLRVLVHPIPDPQFRAIGWWRRKTDTKLVVSEALGWLTLPFAG